MQCVKRAILDLVSLGAPSGRRTKRALGDSLIFALMGASVDGTGPGSLVRLNDNRWARSGCRESSRANFGVYASFEKNWEG